MSTLIRNATVINEGQRNIFDVLIIGDRIAKIEKGISEYPNETEIIDAVGKVLIPGVIDD